MINKIDNIFQVKVNEITVSIISTRLYITRIFITYMDVLQILGLKIASNIILMDDNPFSLSFSIISISTIHENEMFI